MTIAAPLPRWVDVLNHVLTTNMRKNPMSISYALATSGATDTGLGGAPRVRYVVHRGFVNERRPGEDISWSENAAEDGKGTPFSSATMIVTTDVRGPKAAQIRNQKSVELAWWLSETMHQFRIHADAWILPSPEHHQSNFPADQLAPPGFLKFNWESERLRIYRKMSPDLRASFCRPIPGTPLSAPGREDIDPRTFPKALPTDLEAKTDEEKRLVKIALENFALIVLSPTDVDLCELGKHPNERTHWVLCDGEWSEEAVVA